VPLGLLFEQSLTEQYPASAVGPPYGGTKSVAVFLNPEGIDSNGQRRRLTTTDTVLLDSWRAPFPVLSTTAGVSLGSIGATDLYTVPAGETAYILGALVEIEYAQTVTSDATAGVGISTGESDIFASQQLIMTRAVGDLWSYSFQGKIRTAPAGSIIRFGVDSAATATTLRAKVHLLGYLLP